MAAVHDLGHSERGGTPSADPGAEQMILLTVTAVAGMEVVLLAWLIL